MSKNPFFSIAIPTYGYSGKGSDFLEHSFKILGSQIFKDFEIVISDHSTDDTIQSVCRKWGPVLNIKYHVNEKGRGVISPNINNCISLSSGEWIKILFQDDFLFGPDSLLKQHNFIKEIGVSDLRWFATKFIHTSDGFNFERIYDPVWPSQMWTGDNTIGCPSVITIKNDDPIYFDEDLNWLMDCDYYEKMFSKFGMPAILNEITVVNRTGGNRLTETIPNNIRIKESIIMEKRYGK